MGHAWLTGSRYARQNKTESTLDGEQLLLINVAGAADAAVVVTTVWSTSGDFRGGHRHTEIETVPDLDRLVQRLNQLSAAMLGLDRLTAAA
jgi:hypothetical protein